MSRGRWLALVLAPLAGALIAIGASLVVGVVAPAAAKTRTTTVGVGLHEFRVALYRSRVLPGRVTFDIENLGEDGHDLQVVGPSGPASAVRGTSPEIKAGRRGVLTATLRRRGVYRVICTLGDHAEQGMASRLRVVKRL